MGNHCVCVFPKNSSVLSKKPSMTEQERIRKLLMTVSVSNPSLITLAEKEEDIEIEVTPSLQFNADRMKELSVKFAKENNMTVDAFGPAVLKAISMVLDTIANEDHILLFSMKFHDMLAKTDELFPNTFAEYSEKNVVTHDHKSYGIETRLLIHTMYWLRMHKFITMSIEDGKPEKAYELLKLIALSHLIMKIPAEEFRMQCVRMIKYFLHITLISEDQIPVLSYYFQTTVNYIVFQMNFFKKRSLPVSEVSEVNTLARENYRELKKWKSIVQNVKKSLARPLLQLEKQSDDVKKSAYVDFLEEDEEPWKINRLLKKGYKYKIKETLENASLFKRKKQK